MTLQSVVLALTIVTSGAAAFLSMKMLRFVYRHPRPSGASRRAHRRRLRSLPEYRKSLPFMRIVITAMAASVLLQVFISPAVAFADWIVSAMSLIAIIGVWIVDRRPPGEAETQPR